MFAVYLFSLIFGGGLLLLSLLDIFPEPESGSSHLLFGDHPVGEFLSLRTLLYFAAGFGATGVLLTLAGAPVPVAAGLALVTGTATGAVSSALYRWLRTSESGLMSRSSEHLLGLEGEVVVAVRPGGTGKVRVVSGGRAIELLARGHAGHPEALLRGTPIVILEVAEGTALVAPATSLLPETP